MGSSKSAYPLFVLQKKILTPFEEENLIQSFSGFSYTISSIKFKN